MSFKKRPGILILTVFICTASLFAYHDLGYQYLCPGPDAAHVYKGAVLIIRFEKTSPADLENMASFVIVKNQSGQVCSGTTRIASDNRTLLFTPAENYPEGETVQVSLAPVLRAGAPGLVQPITYVFTVASCIDPEIPEYDKAPESTEDPESQALGKPGSRSNPVRHQAMTMPNGVSVPGDFPHVEITVNDNPDDGLIFIDNRGANMGAGPGRTYNVIFDNTGSPVWYEITWDERRDFKVQPNGWATQMIRDGYGGSYWGFIALDNHYNYVKTFRAANGHYTDEHELRVLEDGGYLLIGRRDDNVDMSPYVDGGQQNAWVITTCVQEFTAADELIFEWSAWDHWDIREIQLSDPRSNRLYFAHINSIDFDEDDHLIISSRELSEVCKINRQTGDFIWRLGGAHNQFTWVNDDELQGFRNQHTARVLGDGVYSFYDNGNTHNPPVSRAVKYRLDTGKMTATLIWQFRDTPDRFSVNMGNAQQLDNGNMLINWARGEHPKLTEVRPDGSKAFEMNFADGYECYRVHRCTWNGMTDVPRLDYDLNPENLVLIFNKFGDPDVSYYKIYASTESNPETFLDTSAVSMKVITDLANGLYRFRVSAVSGGGEESGYSNEVYVYVNFTAPGGNFVENGDFSEGQNSWTWHPQGNVEAGWSVENGEAHVMIQNGGGQDDAVQLRQNTIPLNTGYSYIFEFDARADASRIIEAKIEKDYDPFTNYSKSTYFNLTPAAGHFTWEFEMEDPSDSNARIVFNMGNHNADVVLDNVSLKQKIEQSAYGDTVRVIPGLIECEEYDRGGESVAYHDDRNRDGDMNFRPGDRVDVETTVDEGNGYNICWVSPGEWLEYTVNAESGMYDIKYRTASEPGGGRLNVTLNNRLLCRFDVPATGGWQTWATLTHRGIWIDGGQNLILRLDIIQGNQNLNWIRFIKTSDDSTEAPSGFRLLPNTPNPFSSKTCIRYSIPESGHVSIEVFDMLGKRVKTLVSREKEPGSYEVFWDGTYSGSGGQSSGVYLVRMQCGHFHTVKKVVLLK